MASDRSQNPLMRSGIVCFALGLVAILAVVVLYASGARNLPLWLNLCAGILTPLGLALGLLGLAWQLRTRPRGQRSTDPETP
ncbi:MAG: hypothetical protein ACRDRL_20800 [Sciscionella sp.]